jgi:hypothetical protein
MSDNLIHTLRDSKKKQKKEETYLMWVQAAAFIIEGGTWSQDLDMLQLS